MSDLLPLFLGLLAGLVLAAAPFSRRVRRLRAELGRRETELAASQDERRRLENELQAARLRPVEHTAEILADNADLRRRIDELADALLSRQGRADPGPDPSVAPDRPAL